MRTNILTTMLIFACLGSASERFSLRAQTNGVYIALSPLASTLSRGEPVLLKLIVSNHLSEAIRLDLGHDRKDGLLFVLTRPDGDVVRLPRKNTDGIGKLGAITLLPSETYEQVLILDEWQELNMVGKYTIALRLVEPIVAVARPSEAIILAASVHTTVEVGARSEERLRQVCEDLLRPIATDTYSDDATTALVALTYVRDPIAVPFLVKAIEGKMGTKSVIVSLAIPGLLKLADQGAVDALMESISLGRDENRLARSTLRRIEQAAKDASLRDRIGRFLGPASQDH